MVIFAASFDHYSTSQILKRFTQASITGPGTIVAGQGRYAARRRSSWRPFTLSRRG